MLIIYNLIIFQALLKWMKHINHMCLIYFPEVFRAINNKLKFEDTHLNTRISYDDTFNFHSSLCMENNFELTRSSLIKARKRTAYIFKVNIHTHVRGRTTRTPRVLCKGINQSHSFKSE